MIDQSHPGCNHSRLLKMCVNRYVCNHFPWFNECRVWRSRYFFLFCTISSTNTILLNFCTSMTSMHKNVFTGHICFCKNRFQNNACGRWAPLNCINLLIVLYTCASKQRTHFYGHATTSYAFALINQPDHTTVRSHLL